MDRLTRLLSAGAHGEVIAAADRLASDPSVSPMTREFALWMKVSTYQSTQDHRAVVREADRALEFFPHGAFRQALANARSSAQKVLGIQARLRLGALLDESRFTAAIAAADSLLAETHHGQNTYAIALHAKIRAHAAEERHRQVSELVADFGYRFPDSELLPSVQGLDRQAKKLLQRGQRTLIEPSLVLQYRDLLDYELLTPLSVTTRDGAADARPPIESLIDYRSPALASPWVSPAAARVEVRLQLPAATSGPAFVGVQFPRTGQGRPRQAVLEVAQADGKTPHSFSCDLEEANI